MRTEGRVLSAARSRRVIEGAWHGLVLAGSVGSTALTLHTVVNLRLLRTPEDEPSTIDERVSILLPVRNEAARVGPCLSSLQVQRALADVEIHVLDDDSTDETAKIVTETADGDPRITLLAGAELPEDWLGKPHACHQLAQGATGSVLVFVDADVRFQPHAVAAAVGLLREHGLDLVSPYPRQIAKTPVERLMQPLLQWSWLTTLPLRTAERSARPSTAAANGQFIVVDAAAYQRAGGHAAIKDEVLDDVALLRQIKAAGGKGGMADGTTLASCRMYDSGWDLIDGYRKSLWSAFGSPAKATAAMTLLAVVYIVPPLAALTGSVTGLAGYLSALAGRIVVGRRTESRILPDIFAHPIAIAALTALTASSIRGRRRGELTWRGRPLVTEHADPDR